MSKVFEKWKFLSLFLALFIIFGICTSVKANEFAAGTSVPVIKTDKTKYNIDQTMYLQLNDLDSDKNSSVETVQITVTSEATGASCKKALQDNGAALADGQFGDISSRSDINGGASVFGVTFSLVPYSSADGAPGANATLEVAISDTITITFTSADGDSASITRTIGYEEGVFTGTTESGLVVGADTIDGGNNNLTAENQDYANANIEVYLKDNDLNNDSTTAETVILDVVTASGSTKTLTLKESGKNTGVFYGKIAAAYATATVTVTDANGVENNGLPTDDGVDTPCVVTISNKGDTVTVRYRAATKDVLPDGSQAQTSFDIPLGLGTKGTITVDKESYLKPDKIIVTVTDPDLNADPNTIETIAATDDDTLSYGELFVSTSRGGEGDEFNLVETGPNTGVFKAILTTNTNETPGDDDLVIAVDVADTITFKYKDQNDGNTDPTDDTISTTASYSMVNGTVSISPTIAANGTTLTIDITDPDRNLSSTTIDKFTSNTAVVATPAQRATNAPAGYVKIESTQGDILGQDANPPGNDAITFTETGVNTNIFRATVVLNIGATVDNDGILDAAIGDTLTVTYYDPDDVAGNPSTFTATALAQAQVASLAFDASSYDVNDLVTVTLTDNDLNTSATTKQTDNTSLTLKSTSDAIGIKVNLTETEVNSGVFQGKVRLAGTTNDIATGIDALKVAAGDTLTLVYVDVPAGTLQATATVEANTGTIELSKTSLSLTDECTVTVVDNDLNTSATAIDTVAAATNTVVVKSNSDATGTGIKLTETGVDTGIFTGKFKTGAATAAGDIPTIVVAHGDNVSVVYTDAKNAALQTNTLVTATATAGEQLATITFDTDTAILGEAVTITVSDRDADTNAAAKNSIDVNVFTETDPIGITLTLLETGVHTGIFSGTVKTSATSTITQNQVKAAVGDTLSVSYIDNTDADPIAPKTKVVESIPVSELMALTASPDTVTVEAGATIEATATGGIPPYIAESSDDTVAAAIISDGTITIIGVAEGSCTITVTDSSTPALDLILSNSGSGRGLYCATKYPSVNAGLEQGKCNTDRVSLSKHVNIN